VSHIPSRIIVALFLAAGLAAAARAADPPEKAPGKEQVAEWVKGLASDSFEEREKASKMLWKAGRAAEEALRQVLKDGDAESVRRAREILDKFEWGLYPDTPEAVSALIEEYRSGEPQTRAGVVPKLLDKGGPGFTALMKIAAMEKDADARQQIWDLVGADMPRLAAALLADGQGDRLGEVLEQGLAGDGEQPRANYAAWLMTRGKLDEKIRELEKKGAPDKRAALTLAYLCRAKGDLPAARKYAEKAEHDGLLKTILVEQEDWKGLLKHLDTPAPPPAGAPAAPEVMDPVGLRLACLRLAGDQKGFDAELRKQQDSPSGRIGLGAALLLNGRPDDALASLRQTKQTTAAAELLAARLRFREAYDEADQVKPAEKGGDPFTAGLYKAQLLARLGDRKKAREAFDKLLDSVKDGAPGTVDPIIGAEFNAGFKEDAFARLATLMAKLEEVNAFGTLNILFQSADLDAGVGPWWIFLRGKFPKDDAAATIKRMRDLFSRKVPARDAADLLKEMADEAAKRKDEERGPWLQCVADSCRLLGRDDLRETYLEKWAAAGGDAAAWQRLGDIAADSGRWKDAADRYRRGWEKDRAGALLLYLHGRALVKAGQEKEGKRWMEVAEAMPLGNEQMLAALAQGLEDHDLPAEAGKVWERLSRLTLTTSFFQGSAAQGMASSAAAAKDYAKAANWTRREILYFLGNPVSDQPEPLLALVATEHRYRALAHAAAGRLDDMRKEVNAVLEIEPEIELAIDLVTELTKRGHKKEADDLFTRVYSANDAVCKDYPNSGWAHNNTAWLAVRCNRNLDAALEHARKATALEPDMSSHLDTLAEVHFQRGDKDKAVELEKKCVEMQPGYEYFRKQVKRMQAGDRNAELPPEPAAGSLYRWLGEGP
jgi:tetratricopeptide (TPR) repeat protein